MAKISVIVPIYNTEVLLRRCLDSLRNQTERDIEFILVDDASTDKSIDIMEAYRKKDARFKIISLSQNEGVSIARNKGLEIATGKYIGFVDSDDYIDYDYYEVLAAAIDQSNIPISFSQSIEPALKEKEIVNYKDENTYLSIGDASSCCHLFTRSLIGEERFLEHTRFEDSAFTFAMNMKSGASIVAANTKYYYCNDNEFSFNSLGIYSLKTVLDSMSVADYLGTLAEKNIDYACYRSKIYNLQIEFLLDTVEYIHTITTGDRMVELLNHLSVLIDKKYGLDIYQYQADHIGVQILEYFADYSLQEAYLSMKKDVCEESFKSKVKSIIKEEKGGINNLLNTSIVKS